MNNPVLLIALQEFKLNRRNKWVVGFAIIFTLVTFFISYFGMVTSGYSGFQDFARTSTSLINITGFLIPLFALLLGVFSFISNNDYLELLVTQPVSRFTVILGKYFGLILTLFVATIIGFCTPGALISLTIGLEGASGYVLVLLFSLFLGVIFIGCATFIAQMVKRQQIALGIAIGGWIFFEIVFGLLILGSTLYFSPSLLKSTLLFSLLANPIDLVRVLSLLVVGGAEFFGPAGATLIKMAGSEIQAILLGIGGMILWMIIPLFGSLKIFSRQNL